MMSKPTRQVALAIAEDALIETAQSALDSANSMLADAWHDAEAELDRL
jgi:hypothetical protein